MSLFRRFLFLPAVLLLLLALASCNKLKDLVTFKMSYTSEITVPSSTGLSLPIDLITPPVATNSESQFESNNTSKNLVKEIYLENVDISVKSPSGRDLSFLRSVHVYISANGLAELEMAFRDNIPDDIGSSLALETSGEDFRDYIVQDSYSLRVEAETDKLISDDVVLEVRSRFLVKAGIID